MKFIKSATLPFFWKKITKNKRPILFFKLFHNLHWHVNKLLIFLSFFQEFSYIHTTICVWNVVSWSNFHRLYDWLIYTFWYINISDVTAGYEMPLVFVALLWIFTHVNNNHSYLKYCMFTKFLPNLCLINTHNKSDKPASYGTFICNWIFKHYYIGFKHYLKRNIFIKLSKIERWKVNLFKHLWLHQFSL